MRLRIAIEHRDWSDREFARKVKAANIRPQSRAIIQRYLDGSAEPPVSFLIDVARLLHVRFEWLASGQGPPSAPTISEAEPQRIAIDEAVVEVAEEILRRYPNIMGFPLGAWGALRFLTWEVFAATGADRPRSVPTPEEEAEAIAAIADALICPLERLKIEIPREYARMYLQAAMSNLLLVQGVHNLLHQPDAPSEGERGL